MIDSLLITAYYPPISYFSCIKNSDSIYIEAKENYQRQTIRNRCYIQTSNGIQMLSVPIKKNIDKSITSIKIDYSTPWNYKHAHAIRSAYGKSPFFIYYYEELISPLFEKYETLFQLNQAIIEKCIKLLQLNKKIQFTKEYLSDYIGMSDLRSNFSKKKGPYIQNFNSPKYIQTFSDRFPFMYDLSVLDLIFNTGKEAILYL